jgi:alkanesulfonate monooxygenase SsuD/methylene tetrahydromethanopterin reductase-like flavin-dependent oxidoreductase (luciferase family)
MRFAFAHFINPVGGPEAVAMYKRTFKSSVNLPAPEALVAIFGFCSEDQEKVNQNRRITEYRFLQFERGIFEPVAWEDVKDLNFTPYEQERMAAHANRMIVGTPAEVQQQLTGLARAYQVEEIMIVNIAQNFEDRLRSYELLAGMFL